MTDNRRPQVFARVPQEDLELYQRLAARYYDGNLSLFVRQAVRDLATYHGYSERRGKMQAARLQADEREEVAS